MDTTKLPETDDEIEEFIRQCESGEIPEPPPFNSSKLLARMCVMQDRIDNLEAECTRLHKLWSDAHHENECARITMCKYGAAFAADSLSGVIVRTIEVLDTYRQNA